MGYKPREKAPMTTGALLQLWCALGAFGEEEESPEWLDLINRVAARVENKLHDRNEVQRVIEASKS